MSPRAECSVCMFLQGDCLVFAESANLKSCVHAWCRTDTYLFRGGGHDEKSRGVEEGGESKGKRRNKGIWRTVTRSENEREVYERRELCKNENEKR